MISQDPGGGAAVAPTSHRPISVHTVLGTKRISVSYPLFPGNFFWLNVAPRRQWAGSESREIPIQTLSLTNSTLTHTAARKPNTITLTQDLQLFVYMHKRIVHLKKAKFCHD